MVSASPLSKIGETLRERRRRLKVSATATAESASISRMTLYRIERGDPSVALGAYWAICQTLGLELQVTDPSLKRNAKVRASLPEKIRLADYPELKRLAWQIKKSTRLTPEQALQIYQRNWRHLDRRKLSKSEREFIRQLALIFGREDLLV